MKISYANKLYNKQNMFEKVFVLFEKTGSHLCILIVIVLNNFL